MKPSNSVFYTLVDHTEDFVVVNKSPGVQVQSPQHQEGEGLLQLVCKDLDIEHLYPVHRLDQDTSGLIVMAKTSEANRSISTQFQERTVSKEYIAFSDRKGSKKQGTVIGDMVKTRKGNWKLSSDKSNPAVTQFFSFSLHPGQRLFSLKPHTGKTHQLRVMMKALGCPILGDDRYGGPSADRLYLHSWKLAFDWAGERLEYSAWPESGELFLSSSFCQLGREWLSEERQWPVLKL